MQSTLHPIEGTRYMVSSGHYLATQAAFEILEAGGNAIDAGVAANLVLGVVQSDQVNVAGVAPILLRLGDTGEVLTLSGLGGWPAAASLEAMIAAHGEQLPLGILRTVVPAAPDANIQALLRYGTLSFGEVAGAAIRYARDGFSMHRLMSHYVDKYQHQYRLWPENARIYLPGGAPPVPGKNFVQTDLAASLQFMVDQERAAAAGGREAGLEAARAAFYTGDLARVILDFHRDNGGLLAEADLAGFRCAIEPAVRITVRGFGEPFNLYTCGPWCQGPVLAQMLRLVEGFDLAAFGHNTPAYLHVLIEAVKLAFADRERYYGDPRFVDVPIDRLLSEAYADSRRRLIDPARAWAELPPPGSAGDTQGVAWHSPRAEGAAHAPRDTSYVCVVDADDNVFSCNPSDVTWESPVVPGTGLCPSSRGSQSWLVPGHASSLAPGKRPRLTPNPCLVVRSGERLMPIGTPGGDTQPQAVMQVLLNMFVFGMEGQAAIDAPRFVSHSQPDSFAPHQSHPGRVTLEGRVAPASVSALDALGHRCEVLDDLTWDTGGVCLIDRNLGSRILQGGADPRRPSRVMGW